MASQFSGLPMKALIGSPLKAATDANAMIAQSQTQYLITTCFERPNPDSPKLRPIMVEFEVSRSVIDKDGHINPTPLKMTFAMPLMTLIPINSLAIETLEVSFEMEVKSSREFSRESDTDIEQRGKRNHIDSAYKAHEFDTELHGSISSKSSGNDRAAASYEIKLTAGQLPLPRGITTIIDVFHQNMMPMPAK